MNFLEEIAAEWYEYSGYFVRSNIKTLKREKGGWDGEIDVLAFHPGDKELIHVETSGDAAPWPARKDRFLNKKFVYGHKDYERIVGAGISEVQKIAVVGYCRMTEFSLDWRDDIEVFLVPKFLQMIADDLRNKNLMRQGVPEGYPLLRTIQMITYYDL